MYLSYGPSNHLPTCQQSRDLARTKAVDPESRTSSTLHQLARSVRGTKASARLLSCVSLSVCRFCLASVVACSSFHLHYLLLRSITIHTLPPSPSLSQLSSKPPLLYTTTRPTSHCTTAPHSPLLASASGPLQTRHLSRSLTALLPCTVPTQSADVTAAAALGSLLRRRHYHHLTHAIWYCHLFLTPLAEHHCILLPCLFATPSPSCLPSTMVVCVKG